MKKYILMASFVVIAALGSLLAYARPQQDERKLACRRGCNESFAACLSQTPATDSQKEEERKSVCRQRQADCLKYCE